MLEEYVMADDVSDDVGVNLMKRDDDFEPPEVPFQPKPTSVSIAAVSADFSSESNFTTMPSSDDIHQQHTVILARRPSQQPVPAPQAAPEPPPRSAGRSPAPPPAPPPRPSPQASPRPPARPIYDEELHSAPTMIIDIRKIRGRSGR